MSFIQWLNMNLAVDIACLVYMAALTWKNFKIQKEIEKMQLILTSQEEKIDLCIKNPAAARRKLNQNKK